MVALVALAMVCMMVMYLRYDYAMGAVRGIPQHTRFEESDSLLSKHVHVSNYKYGDYDRLAAKFNMEQFKQLRKRKDVSNFSVIC